MPKDNVPEAPAQGPSNGTEKDSWGKGAAEGAPKMTTPTPSGSKSSVKV